MFEKLSLFFKGHLLKEYGSIVYDIEIEHVTRHVIYDMGRFHVSTLYDTHTDLLLDCKVCDSASLPKPF